MPNRSPTQRPNRNERRTIPVTLPVVRNRSSAGHGPVTVGLMLLDTYRGWQMSVYDSGSDQGRVEGAPLDRRVTADLEATCRSLCRLVVPAVADLAVVYTVDGTRLVRSGSASAGPVVSSVADSVFGGLTVKLGTDHPLATIVERRRPLFMDKISSESMTSFFGGRVPATFERLGLRSIVALPLIAHDHALGLLGL